MEIIWTCIILSHKPFKGREFLHLAAEEREIGNIRAIWCVMAGIINAAECVHISEFWPLVWEERGWGKLQITFLKTRCLPWNFSFPQISIGKKQWMFILYWKTYWEWQRLSSTLRAFLPRTFGEGDINPFYLNHCVLQSLDNSSLVCTLLQYI